MSQELIDNSVFNELAESVGTDFAAELVGTFLTDADSLFDSLNQAVENRDADGYRRAAHTIKSNAQTFGATVLAEQARDMELSGVFDASAVTKMRTLFLKTAAALESLLDD